jgi:D-amino-acid oxidase
MTPRPPPVTGRRCAAYPAQVPDVTVVGAGVSGLTCAVRLLQAGHQVRVVPRNPPSGTTSAVAAALWYPYLAEPRHRVTAWAVGTLPVLTPLAGDAAAGVRLRRGVELLREPAGPTRRSG